VGAIRAQPCCLLITACISWLFAFISSYANCFTALLFSRKVRYYSLAICEFLPYIVGVEYAFLFNEDNIFYSLAVYRRFALL
jgi:hypothetical protein